MLQTQQKNMADRSGEESESQLKVSIDVKLYFFGLAMDHGMCNFKLSNGCQKNEDKGTGRRFQNFESCFPHSAAILHRPFIRNFFRELF